jgi:eukaryotic-like serine/threonine-protein kinase
VADEVQLRRRWTLGARIGDPSGFGQVFEATCEDGEVGVVKLVPKEPGAEREMLFEDLAGVPNVVPIIDLGETANAWALAMPRAETSLRVHLEASGRRLPPEDAVAVLVDIATALAELDGRVVHRDLKPENVLRVNGRWCLADFGTARYAEASTSPDTRKMAMSAPYAAPERWRFEHATSAADVYSLGVIAFELLAGARPFGGPGWDDFRNQHLHVDAPELMGVPALLAALVAECMWKAPGSRPAPKDLLIRLERALTPTSQGAARLQAAHAAQVEAQARAQAAASSAASEAERRKALCDGATASLKVISVRLRQAVLDNAPSALPDGNSKADDWALKLGAASIGMDPPKGTATDPWGHPHWAPPFEVIAFAGIGITIPRDRYGYQGRLHSLWYCDAQQAGVYRWFETGFMVSPLVPKTSSYYPIAFEPCENAGKALSNTIAEWQVAWPFTPIDQGEEGAFVERWLEWFGQAAAGELHRPSSMPERPPHGSWRRA